MSFFKKFFGSTSEPAVTESEEKNPYAPQEKKPTDEWFVTNFLKNGGKFLYCENLDEVHENFLNILVENDWFECSVVCFEDSLTVFLKENKLNHINPINPKFFLCSCENLVADEGSVMLSSTQLKHYKPSDLPENMIVFATTSQLCDTKSDGMRMLKKKYTTQYPSNITTIRHFKKVESDNFMQYGSSVKNIYLLLLEDN